METWTHLDRNVDDPRRVGRRALGSGVNAIRSLRARGAVNDYRTSARAQLYAHRLATLADTLAAVETRTDLQWCTRVEQAIRRAQFPASISDDGQAHSTPILGPGKHVFDPVADSWSTVTLLLLADALRAFASAPQGSTARIEVMGLEVCHGLTDELCDEQALLRALPWDLVSMSPEFRTSAYGVELSDVAATCCISAVRDVLDHGIAAVHRHRQIAGLWWELVGPLKLASARATWREEPTSWLCTSNVTSLLTGAGLVEQQPKLQETMKVLETNWTGTIGELIGAAASLSK